MGECIFCKIIKGEIPCEKVYEDETIFAFKDIQPQAPVHILIIPKEHISSNNAVEERHAKILGHIFIVARNIAKEFGLEEAGYRIVTNCGEAAGQTVHHIHYHLIGGRMLNWPPG